MCFLAALVLKEIRLFYGTDTLSFSLNLLKTESLAFIAYLYVQTKKNHGKNAIYFQLLQCSFSNFPDVLLLDHKFGGEKKPKRKCQSLKFGQKRLTLGNNSQFPR